MNKTIALLVIILFSTGCSNTEKIILKGVTGDGENEYIYLNLIDIDRPVLIDSAKINSSGSFRFSFSATEPNFYTLGYNESEFITILPSPSEELEIRFNGDRLQDDYTITGSPDSEKIRILDARLKETLRKLDSLNKVYESVTTEAEDNVTGRNLEDQYLKVIDDQRKYNIEFILNNLTSLASIKALYQMIDEETYVLYKPRDVQFLKLVTDSLSAYYPGIKQVRTLASNLENELNAYYMNQFSDMIGEIEPSTLDATLLDIDGNRISLSSLRGKYYVLLSFWLPQSEECVSQNIQLKEIYSRYHSRGFEIYQVNVGDDEEIWKNAVRYDELPWISVREDDASYPQTAITYNITGVPANYLLDKNGEIIGKNLSGRSLQIKLSQLFD